MPPFIRRCYGRVPSIHNETKLVRKKIYQLVNKSYLNYHLLGPPKEYYLHPISTTLYRFFAH
jgi:hypothetical protein